MDQSQTIAELKGVARRRLPLFVLLSGVGSAAAVVYALGLPSVYESSTKILVESPQIADELARSTVNLTASARLQLIEQRLLTRDSLEEMIDRLGLFADSPGLEPDSRIAILRQSIRIERIAAAGGNPWGNDGGVVAFTIAVTWGDPVKAAEIAQELARSAIAQNVQVRTERARDTLAYFDTEERTLAASLREIEDEISRFKSANKDALPEALEANRASLARLTDADLTIDAQILEVELRQAELRTGAASGASGGPGAPASSETEARRLELELAQRREVLGPRHPQIRQLEQQLAAVRALAERDAAEAASEAAAEETAPRPRTTADAQIAGLADRIVELRQRKEAIAAQRAALEDAIGRTPQVEAELATLNRRAVEMQERYADVARRRAEARTGEQLEANQQSERFEILEPALPPEHPVGPNRKKVVVMGAGLSAALAGGLGLALEFLNGSMRTTSQMERKLGIRPVVSIPYVAAPGEAWRRRAVWLGGVAAALIALWFALPFVDRHLVPLDTLDAALGGRLSLGGDELAGLPADN